MSRPYYAFPRAHPCTSDCKVCEGWRKGSERLPVAARRQLQDDPRDEPHAPFVEHHEWCRCWQCAEWPVCECGDPYCTGYAAEPSAPHLQSPSLRRPLGPLLRAPRAA